MKKLMLHKLILMILMLMTVSIIALGCNNDSSEKNINPVYFSISYFASEGGYIISGNSHQVIKQGDSGTEITATAKNGYTFVKWSDGLTTATRQEINVQSNMSLTAIFSRSSFSLNYTATPGGQIVGNNEQSVEFDESATEITAMPYENYLFAGWSDGLLSETRLDKNIQADLEVHAMFVSKTKIFKYEYNNATSNISEKNITLSYGNLSDISFAIPERERFTFGGWFLEPDFKTKVADETGKLFLGNGVFFSESDTLYAKWTAADTYTYKILMVFVDEVHAQLKTANGTLVNVDYKMSLVERKICELIPGQISKYLNEWFEGVVNFEIDTYFTTISLGNEAFSGGTSSSGKFDYDISALNIPEVGSILKNYRSIITTSSMNDYDSLLQSGAGSGSEKYATIHMEFFLSPFKINNIPLEQYLELNFFDWQTLLTVYIHELTHTVEMAIEAYEYHDVIKYYWNQISELETTRLYLLNQAIVDGQKVGIPFEYWKGEINVIVNYLPSYVGGWDNGKIVVIGDEDNQSNAILRKVLYGSSFSVEAVAFEGYQFSHWSDGVVTAVRHDTNIISYLMVTAIFVPI